MAGPLSGTLVVSLEQAVAAPFCTARLADAGARVIKIERPTGDFARDYDHAVHGESAYFVWLNRGKESLVLDLKSSTDASLLAKIIAKCDIFVQNLAPGAAQRAGFGSDDLRQRHPRLITCDISGYGEDGPLAAMKAYDLLIQCETGLASITGTPDAPGRVGVSIADIACGMYAHAAVMEALLQRSYSGQGAGCAVSLFDAIADWMTVPLLQFFYGGSTPQRVGLAHASIVPYGAYLTADARQIVIAVQNEREWREFCTHVLSNTSLTMDPRFDGNEARVANRDACNALVAACFRQFPLETLRTLLLEARIAFSSVNSVTDLWCHPQLRRAQIDTPSGLATIVAPPARWRDRQFTGRSVPGLGEHSRALRKEFT